MGEMKRQSKSQYTLSNLMKMKLLKIWPTNAELWAEFSDDETVNYAEVLRGLEWWSRVKTRGLKGGGDVSRKEIWQNGKEGVLERTMERGEGPSWLSRDWLQVFELRLTKVKLGRLVDDKNGIVRARGNVRVMELNQMSLNLENAISKVRLKINSLTDHRPLLICITELSIDYKHLQISVMGS